MGVVRSVGVVVASALLFASGCSSSDSTGSSAQGGASGSNAGGNGGGAGASGGPGGASGSGGAGGAGGAGAALGIASKYPGDVGIANDPDVIFADDFESYGAAGDLLTKWDNFFQASGTRIATGSGDVFAGKQSLEFSLPQQTAELSNGVQKILKNELDLLYLRFYAKFDPSFAVTGEYARTSAAVVSAAIVTTSSRFDGLRRSNVSPLGLRSSPPIELGATSVAGRPFSWGLVSMARNLALRRCTRNGVATKVGEWRTIFANQPGNSLRTPPAQLFNARCRLRRSRARPGTCAGRRALHGRIQQRSPTIHRRAGRRPAIFSLSPGIARRRSSAASSWTRRRRRSIMARRSPG